MRNQKFDQICAKRLQATDFAKPKHQPIMTRGEVIAATIMLTTLAIGLCFMTYTTYFGG